VNHEEMQILQALTESAAWKVLEKWIHSERELLQNQLTEAKDLLQIRMLQARIKALDWIRNKPMLEVDKFRHQETERKRRERLEQTYKRPR
jgi:hypothetical protein